MGAARPLQSRGEAPQPEKTQQKRKAAKPSDFSHEYREKTVVVVLAAGNPSVLRGRLEAASKYWVKLAIGQRTLYVNKAWIVSIEPVG
jgi:hypothetical protein